MLALGSASQTHGERVILAPRRPRQNRRVQVAVVVSYAKTCSNRRDRRGCDQEKQKADKSLAEPSPEQSYAADSPNASPASRPLSPHHIGPTGRLVEHSYFAPGRVASSRIFRSTSFSI